MKSIPTMKDIADELDITVMSVSKALSGKEGVSDELRARIVAKAEEIGYKKSAPVKETSSKNIGILVAARSLNADATFMSLQQSVISQLSQVDYYGLTEIIHEDTEHLLILPKLIKDKKIDGFILLGTLEPAYIDMLRSVDLPNVLLTFDFGDQSDGGIICDNLYAGYTLTQYLFKNGYRNIGFIGNPNFDTISLDRYLGFIKALIKNKVPYNADNVINDVSEMGDEQPLFLPDNLPDAFVCNNCRVAYKLIHYLEGLEHEVPADIAVVAFDDGIYADFGIPKLTTFSFNYDEMAQMAVESIIVKMQDKNVKLGKKIIFGKVIERDSVKIRIQEI